MVKLNMIVAFHNIQNLESYSVFSAALVTELSASEYKCCKMQHFCREKRLFGFVKCAILISKSHIFTETHDRRIVYDIPVLSGDQCVQILS